MEIDWEKVSADLDERGSAVIGRLFSPPQCRSLAARCLVPRSTG